MVDLFQLPLDTEWTRLGAWQWVGEFETYAAALEECDRRMAEDPRLHAGHFALQGKMVLN